MNVVEFGTGSGYSGALLAELVGPTGRVTSLDNDTGQQRTASEKPQNHEKARHPDAWPSRLSRDRKLSPGLYAEHTQQ
ncbi:hypothetical protein [Streptomyces anulatus]|uniref:hypothetical protein n=1 Tax=Streptomyces anulatus TaxID=1892 RepID=UPI0035561CA9